MAEAELISTLEVSSEFDALAMLRPDEPYFMLLGRDRLAPQRVLDWALVNRERAMQEFKGGKIDAEKRDRELRKSTQAEAKAWTMEAYKAGHLARAAALQAEPRPSYSGAKVPDETERTDKIAKARVKTAHAIHQCISELHEASAMFREAGLVDEANALDAKQATLRLCAELLGPRTRQQALADQPIIPGHE